MIEIKRLEMSNESLRRRIAELDGIIERKRAEMQRVLDLCEQLLERGKHAN